MTYNAKKLLRVGYRCLNSVNFVLNLFIATKWFRKWLYAGIAGYGLYRYWVGSIIAALLVAVMTVPASAQTLSGYPEGSRNPGEWYYCFGQKDSVDGSSFLSTWDATHCDLMLFAVDEGGGGGYHSVQFEASVHGRDSGQFVRAYIIPSRGIKSYTYHCIAAVAEKNHLGAGSSSVGAKSADGGTWFTNVGAWAINPPGSIALGTIGSTTLDVVGSHTAAAYDKFWTDAPDMTTFTGPISYPYFEVTALAATTAKEDWAEYSCSITDWEEWPEWLATNPPFVPYIPSEPTPVPTPAWGATPWVPITDTTNMPNIGIGAPGVETCTTVIPGYAWEWAEVEYGWSPVEFCSTEYDIDISLFGVDLGSYLTTGFLLSGVAVLVSIIKRA